MTRHVFQAILVDKENNQEFLVKWREDKKYLSAKNVDNSSFRLYLNSIIDIQRQNEHLNLITYPLINNKRERKLYSISSNELPQLEIALKAASAFKNPPHNPSQKAVDERHFYLLINPFAGQKRAEELWAKLVKPLFDEMGIKNGHATELVKELDIDKYVAVGVLSGDGLVSEVLNGFLKRPDFKRALRVPIVHLPLGTSNALGAAICYHSREPFSTRGVFVKEIALMCSQPFYRRLALYHVQTEKDGDWPLFMTATWGLMADIDLGSERFRWLGMLRLHVEAFIRIAQLPKTSKYSGRISYKPIEDKQLLRNTLLKAQDILQKLGREHFQPNSSIEIVDPNKELNKDGTIEGAFRNSQLVADKNGKIPPLNEPVPSDWTTIEGEFVYITVSGLSHLGSDLPYVPTAKLDEEVLYLTLVDWRALKSRLHMGHLLITIDHCSHMDHSSLHIIPVTACRIEPAKNAGGYVAMDGEPCESGSAFQVFSTNLKATVIGREIE